MFWIYVCISIIVLFLSYTFFWTSGKISDLRKRYVFITGCDSGFGHLLACKLDQLGVNVFAGCLTEHGAKTLQGNCSEKLVTVHIDVTKKEDISRAVKFVNSKLSANESLWGLVNNAGIDIPSPVDWASESDMRRIFDVNVWGMVNITKAFLPLLKKSKGRVVNVASAAGRLPFPLHAAYCMSKHAVESFSDCLRVEIKHFGVSVHIIEPGFYRTNLADGENLSREYRRVWASLDENIKKDYEENYIKEVCDKTMMLASMCSTNTYEVSDAMEHALLSIYPKSRYRVNWKFTFYSVLFLPTWLTDGAYNHVPCP